MSVRGEDEKEQQEQGNWSSAAAEDRSCMGKDGRRGLFSS